MTTYQLVAERATTKENIHEVVENYKRIRERLYGVRRSEPMKPQPVLMAPKVNFKTWLEAARIGLEAAHRIADLDIKPSNLPSAHSRLHTVAQKYGITIKQLKGKYRGHALRQARLEAFWLLNHVDGHSTTASARMMGREDHTTTIHAVRRYKQLQRIAMGSNEKCAMSGIDLSKIILGDDA